MTKAQLTEVLNRSRARYKVLLDEQKQQISALNNEIRQIKKDVAKFGKIVQRIPFPRGIRETAASRCPHRIRFLLTEINYQRTPDNDCCEDCCR